MIYDFESYSLNFPKKRQFDSATEENIFYFFIKLITNNFIDTVSPN